MTMADMLQMIVLLGVPALLLFVFRCIVKRQDRMYFASHAHRQDLPANSQEAVNTHTVGSFERTLGA